MRWAVLVYAGLGAIGALLALVLGHSPWACQAAVSGLGTGESIAASLGLGLLLGLVTVVMTPRLVARFAWARELHASLRPAVRGRSEATLLLLAIASGVSEELVFRGLLTQVLGLVPAAIAFGLLHQVRGASRWAWVAWATGMGLGLGGIFVVTGSLAGPVLAHVLVNAQNLRFLRDHDESPKGRKLGGLLGSA